MRDWLTSDKVLLNSIFVILLVLIVFVGFFTVTTILQSVWPDRAWGGDFPLAQGALPMPSDMNMSLSDCNGVTVLLWNFKLNEKSYSVATSDHRWALYQHSPVKHVWLGHWTEDIEPIIDKEFDTFEEARVAYPGGCRWLSLGPVI